MNHLLVLMLALGILVSACKETEPSVPAQSYSSVTLVVKHTAGASQFTINGEAIQLQNGNSLVVSNLAYYISNIGLVSVKGDTVRDRYKIRLVRGSATSDSALIQIDSVPVDSYKAVVMNVGVPRIYNMSTDQVGDLDISNGMAWSWDTGYKFILLEGNTPIPGSPSAPLIYHVGFNETFSSKSVLLTKSGGQTGVLAVKNSEINRLVMTVDVAEIFNGIDTRAVPVIMQRGANNSRVMRNFVDNAIKKIETR
jgi:hypothetical protein